MASVEWIQNKVAELRFDNKREKVLSELKSAVDTQNALMRDSSEHLQLEEAFHCLYSSNEDEIQAACQILGCLLASMDSSVVIQQYLNYLKTALHHPHRAVKGMALAELSRAAQQEVIDLLLEDDVILGVISCLEDDVASAKCASTFLIKVAESPVGLGVLFSGKVLDTLKSKLKVEDAIVRFRLFETLVFMAMLHPESFEACHENGFLNSLAAEMDADEIMIQINALEMFSRISTKPFGMSWLKDSKIVDLLINKFSSIEGIPLGYLLFPALLQFFSTVIKTKPEEFIKDYPSVISCILDSFFITEPALLVTVMEITGQIATSLKGKYLMYEHEEDVKLAIQKIGECIQCFPDGLRCRALRAMANILELKESDRDDTAMNMTNTFFNWLSKNPMDLIMTVFRKSYPNLRLAGLHLIKVIAEQPWGQAEIKNSPGMIDFLLDREMESENFCKNCKFAIVKTLVASSSGESVFGQEEFKRLKKSVLRRRTTTQKA